MIKFYYLHPPFPPIQDTYPRPYQNELIDICSKNYNNILLNSIILLIADETTDVSTIEQISLCVRYEGVERGRV